MANRNESMLRARVRAARFAWALVWETSKLALLVHFKPESDRARYRAWRQERACRKFCRILGIELVSVGGARPSGSTVVVANHLGLADPWILAAVLPVAFAAKAEMAGWPVMGWICRTVGIIFVERDRRLAAARFVEELREAGKSGVSVLVFPEGTTGDGRTIRTFKTAGFAAVAGLEDGSVLPVYHNAVRINGAPTTIDDREIMGWTPEQPMMESVFGWLRQKSITVEVRIGEPIACAGMDRKELAALAEQAVRELAGDLVEG